MADGSVGVIPARLGATRFPGKLLSELAGRPVIQHVVRNAGGASRLSRVIVATDDVGIARAAEAEGAEVYRSRLEHATGTDRVGEAVQAMELWGSTIVNVQGDEPLLPPEAIDACVERLSAGGGDIATLATPLDRAQAAEPSVVKVVTTLEGRALYFSRAVVPWSEGGTGHLRHVGIYAFRAGALERFLRGPRGTLERAERLEQLRALELGMRVVVATLELDLVGVDVPEDIARAEAALSRRASRSGTRE